MKMEESTLDYNKSRIMTEQKQRAIFIVKNGTKKTLSNMKNIMRWGEISNLNK